MEQLQMIRDLIGKGLQPGKPRSAGPLTLVPLFGGAVTKEYVLAAEAIDSGQLTITEVPGGSVPELVAHNTGELAALVLDGEHLEGAMQDRVLNISILIPAGQKTLLPVSCVEHGRWGYRERTEFAPSDHMSYSRARMLNLGPVTENVRAGHGARSDQGAVWDEVARKHQEIGSTSDTGAMRDAYSVAQGGIDEILAAFTRPQPGQTGTIACVGGKPVALDAFDKPETLEKLWSRLVSGYAMDAASQSPTPLDESAVVAFLSTASAGQMTMHDAIGLGTDIVITGDQVVGKALAWEEGVVHLSLFSTERDDDGRVYGRGGRIESPQTCSSRTRRH